MLVVLFLRFLKHCLYLYPRKFLRAVTLTVAGRSHSSAMQLLTTLSHRCAGQGLDWQRMCSWGSVCGPFIGRILFPLMIWFGGSTVSNPVEGWRPECPGRGSPGQGSCGSVAELANSGLSGRKTNASRGPRALWIRGKLPFDSPFPVLSFPPHWHLIAVGF